MSRALSGLAITLAAALAGCGDEGGEPSRWVGSIEGTDAVVAAVSNGEEAVVYVCGGASTYASWTRWLRGPVEGGRVTLEKDGIRVEGDLASGALTFVAEDGGSARINARSVDENSVFGLYVNGDDGCNTGVVVLDEGGDAPRVQGTYCDAAGARAQVLPILPVEDHGAGISVSIAMPALQKTLIAKSVRSP